MKTMYVDLHMHTNNSDGHYSTIDILKMCEDIGLSIISITDHDSIASYKDIESGRIEYSGCIINGVELSFGLDGRLYDILGYNIDIETIGKWLEEKYTIDILMDNQNNILNDMKSLYSRLGIEYDDGIEISTGAKAEAYNLMKNSVLAHEENKIIAPEFWEKNFYKIHHTNMDSKYYIDETRITPSIDETIDIIHKAGGVVVLAHSGAYGFSDEQMRAFIQYAIDSGVDGLELKYNCHTESQESIILSFVDKYDLVVTGGSDYHGGSVKKHVQLGKVYNDKYIDKKIISKFLGRIKKGE